MRLIAVLGLLALLVSPAVAQESPPCMERETLVGVAAERYGEFPREAALASSGYLLEILRNEETGSWTAIISRPDGTSCVLGSGSYWTVRPAPIGGEPS